MSILFALDPPPSTRMATEQETPRVTAILSRARQILQRARCKGFCALDRRGRAVDPRLDSAVRFCAYGALARAASELPQPHDIQSSRYMVLAQRRIDAALPNQADSLINYNDDPLTTDADILACFDRAIAAK